MTISPTITNKIKNFKAPKHNVHNERRIVEMVGKLIEHGTSKDQLLSFANALNKFDDQQVCSIYDTMQFDGIEAALLRTAHRDFKYTFNVKMVKVGA